MATLNSVQVWKDFKREYETELKYTRKEFNDALEAQAKSLVVNRVIQSFTGRVGPDESGNSKMNYEVKRFGLYFKEDEQGRNYTIGDLDPTNPVINIKDLKFRPAYDGELFNDLVEYLNANFKLKDK